MEGFLIHHTILSPQYTSNSVHPTTKLNLDKWIIYNPDFNLKRKIWTEEEGISFIIDFTKKYSFDILKCYTKEYDGRYKSDILRLCVLYEFGGFYVDVDQEPITPLNDFFDIKKHDFCASSNMGLHNISNGFLFAKKHSEIIRHSIIETIKTYENNIQPGGTHIMGRVITNLTNGEPFKMPLGELKIGSENCLFLHEIGDESLPETSIEFINSFGLYANNDTKRVMNSRYSTYFIDKNKKNEFIKI